MSFTRECGQCPTNLSLFIRPPLRPTTRDRNRQPRATDLENDKAVSGTCLECGSFIVIDLEHGSDRAGVYGQEVRDLADQVREEAGWVYASLIYSGQDEVSHAPKGHEYLHVVEFDKAAWQAEQEELAEELAKVNATLEADQVFPDAPQAEEPTQESTEAQETAQTGVFGGNGDEED